jgi:hypothetical protein
MTKLNRRRCLIAGCAVPLALCAMTRAMADLGSATVTLTGDELRLVADNPVLLHIGEIDPASLRRVLDRLEAISFGDGTKGIADALKQPGGAAAPPSLTPADQALVDQNPALGKAMRDSPEAALDLIRLIKQAAQKK